MKRQLVIAIALLSLVPVQCTATSKSRYIWKQMADGIQYANYTFSSKENERTTVQAFRIDPAKYAISVAVAQNEKEGTTAKEMAGSAGALIAINGGFFTPEHTSIGLIIKDGKRLNPIHKTSWWSVFYIKGGKPAISKPSDFEESKEISMALQVGPRLTVDGRIPKLKEGISTRSAIGIDRQGKVVLLITSGNGISMKELANRMGGTIFNGGFDCPNSMGLDGGSSSQLYAKIGDFELDRPGIAKVTNGIVVLPKK